MSPMLNAAIADLTYLTSGKVGRDYRDGSPFVLAEKGNTFAAIERGVAALQAARREIEDLRRALESIEHLFDWRHTPRK